MPSSLFSVNPTFTSLGDCPVIIDCAFMREREGEGGGGGREGGRKGGERERERERTWHSLPALFACRVDLRIPEEDIVGGYSITSPPHQLSQGGTINLAIQHSDHPPTHWMTTRVQYLI